MRSIEMPLQTPANAKRFTILGEKGQAIEQDGLL
jgi:hypothetical protein